MDRIAVISDIHGNLPALKAVFKDIEENNIERIICIGDLVGKGPNCTDVIDLCKERCEVVVTGNWDRFLSKLELPEDLWYQKRMGEERVQYLGKLPETMGFYLSGRLVRLYHAHPHDIYGRIFHESPLEEKMVLFENPKLQKLDDEEQDSDIVGYGDIHGAFVEYLPGEKVLFNVGSVGNPYDGTPMASYAILEGRLNSKVKDSYGITLKRVIYDVEETINDAIEADVPDLNIYIRETREAVYLRRKK